ncbi:pentapeptide repeat-containing protein [Micromonospora sp. L5]|uniref:pentapeptide repeat-containing protein n=1 Tax=Micromonospora sp. (strain L5) TaxID=648999 RepID=UPI00117C3903|nr:pentapeptide repeat-containing protein [Micromonospora sp. L5]
MTFAALAITTAAAWIMWDAAQVPAKLITSPDLAVRAAQLRVDVIRNILAVGAGTGGLIALFLALRRQYVKERVDHADQEHKNRTADDSKHDAAERRVTDLYVKAAEQLGSEKAAVRLAALYALERVGQDNAEHRQTIMHLICAYLRMPFLSDGNGTMHHSGQLRKQEQEVRATAMSILEKHLRYEDLADEDGKVFPVGGASFWPGMEVNLNGAELDRLPFHMCAARNLSLENTRVLGSTTLRLFFSADGIFSFSGAEFGGVVDMTRAFFGKALFATGAEFKGRLAANKATFGLAIFQDAVFHAATSFHGIHAKSLDMTGARASYRAGRQHVWPEGFDLPPRPNGNNDELGRIRNLRDPS